MTRQWMIYGATGYTGSLVARRAVARGQRPVLAGRDATAVAALAGELNLTWTVLDLAERSALRAALHDVTVVAHCAGPFRRTAAPMLDACLETGTHYLDITGEIPVLTDVLDRDRSAVEANVALVTGVGFDVVPTDCLAGMLAAALPAATTLELAILAGGGVSAGTATTALTSAGGGVRRVGGKLRPAPVGRPRRLVPFPSGQRQTVAVPWGDLVTAHRSTGIGDITVYLAVPGRPAVVGAAATLLRVAALRRLATWAVRRGAPGPSAQTRAATGCEVWAEVRDDAGERRTAALRGPNVYDLTADAVVRAVDRVLDGVGDDPGQITPGAHTPATAFGHGFVRMLDGVTVTEPS
ncbi:saccharopine dehydrogenase family protein [Micromonospora sp. LOL_023]|uniref:saccharopine dehydrogenase family protein n=1 Tax=Micromonospora sp. LOL_023 TaxID=3345418 RepID=UPI003A87AF28